MVHGSSATGCANECAIQGSCCAFATSRAAGDSSQNGREVAGFNSHPIDSREYALQACTSRCVASVIHSNPRPHNRKSERQMRANNQGSPRLAEACRTKIIQGQDGTSQ